MSFERALEFVLQWEGGYVNDPHDAGGETNFGISKRYHPDLDIRNLTKEQVAEIYRKEYWLRVPCDTVSSPYDIVLFDSSVQHLLSRVRSWRSYASTWREYLLLRRTYYHERVKDHPDNQKFLHGWLNRLDALEKLCKQVEEHDAKGLPF